MVTSLISMIRGNIENIGDEWLDLAVGGLVFRVAIPSSNISQLAQKGNKVELFTSLQIREGSMSLFGFLTEDERRTFEILININGIGPKMALNLLSILSPDSLSSAVNLGDIDAFTVVPGVGKKMASRIILELKGKLDLSNEIYDYQSDELANALISLGYTTTEIRKAILNIDNSDTITLEDKIRSALNNLSSTDN
ncbi:MAG: Holliday junction branch migration protein RuvA [Chloroflexi bacterium]|nr:Holliday junction branch migration protein RuvA [Chloroflexota bacterium]|tara:strand:+ start:437 stop:1024 length:588 start_codon:yes stop_codon:yes gene_type:complete